MDPDVRWLVTNRRNGDGRDTAPCQPPWQAAQGAGERPIGTYNRFMRVPGEFLVSRTFNEPQ